jgi:hypothetical protein
VLPVQLNLFPSLHDQQAVNVFLFAAREQFDDQLGFYRNDADRRRDRRGDRTPGAEKREKFRSMLAANEHRVFALLRGLGAALCIETGSLSLSEPTTQHVWCLIASVTYAAAAFPTQIIREKNLLCRAYHRLTESGDTS